MFPKLCFCETLRLFLWFCRLSGILPVIITSKRKITPHASQIGSGGGGAPQFSVSKFWKRYNVVLFFLFGPYCVFSHAMRLHQEKNPTAEWFLMTFGFVGNDFNNLLMLVYANQCTPLTIAILTRLLQINGGAFDRRKCYAFSRLTLKYWLFLITGFLCIFGAYLFVVWTRLEKENFQITFRNFSFIGLGPLMRALILIISTGENTIIVILCLLFAASNDVLVERVNQLLDISAANQTTDNRVNQTISIIDNNQRQIINNDSIYSRETYKYSKLTNERLESIHKLHSEITQLMKEINISVSPMLLSDIIICLYSATFYSYRVVVAPWLSAVSSSRQEVAFYVISAVYRIMKLAVYIRLGYIVQEKYHEPLVALQKAKIFQLPDKLQQQIQTLMIQWSTCRDDGALNASNIVRVGPWLIAPMMGNVITYLLVAIQLQ